MKTKLILAGAFALMCISSINSQTNSSADADAVPVPGTGTANCLFGKQALSSNTSGYGSTAIGYFSLKLNTSGIRNTAVGAESLMSNTTGNDNAAIGKTALFNNTTGSGNTACGGTSLFSNTQGSANSATGVNALKNNTTGSLNTAMGALALFSNQTGFCNTANGGYSLFNCTSGHNTTNGDSTLYNTTTGGYNTAVGSSALFLNTTGDHNSALGCYANTSANNLTNATAIGANAISNASNKIRIGDANVTVIEGQVAFTPSDMRFKTAISEKDVKGLEFINLLRPVVYNFDTRKFTEFLTKNMPEEVRKGYLNKDFSGSTAIRQSGFLAQEVEEAAQKVGYNFNGLHKPENENDNYSIAYSQFVVPLVKAVQELDKQKTEQAEKIAKLEQLVKDLLAKSGTISGLNEQSSGINTSSLGQNEPNPFTHETVIKYSLPRETNIAYLNVYDLSGKQITSFPLTEKGSSSITITTEKLAAGIYIYSIVNDGKITDSKRMIVVEK